MHFHISATAQGSKEIDPPPLSYKKWVLRGQEKITTHLNIGLMSPASFDQMRSACIYDGPNADVKSGTAAMYQFAAGGASPFMGFYYATEVSIGSKTLEECFVNTSYSNLPAGRCYIRYFVLRFSVVFLKVIKKICSQSTDMQLFLPVS